MKKFLLPGILAVFTLFLPARSQANPLDIPYQVYYSTVNTGSVVISTTNFPSAVPSVNTNVVNNEWCIEHLTVSSALGATVSIAWSTNTLTAYTTDYQLVVSTTGVPYDEVYPYRDPYCAPDGQAVLRVFSSVSSAIISVTGYLWKGWNP